MSISYDFIEIGTSNFRTECQKNKGRGIAVEPVPTYINQLPKRANLTLVNAAVSDTNGTANIHYLSPETIEEYKLPWYLRGCNCLGKIHPIVLNHLKNRKLSTDLVECLEVPILTLTQLLFEHSVEILSLLKIDTEGHDCVILNHYFENTTVFAKDIIFESNRWTPSPMVRKTIQLARSHGYKVVSTGYDTHLRYKQ